MRRFLLALACSAFLAAGARLDDARAALLAGQYARAAQLFAPLVRQFPSDSALRLNYGLALQSSGQHAAAQRELTRVVKATPDNANAWLLLGLAYQKQEQPENAIEPLEHAVRLAPLQQFAKLELADAYLASGKGEKAAALFQLLTEQDPKMPKAWQGLGLAHLSIARHFSNRAAEEEALAHRAFDQLATLPESAEMHELLADALQQQGQRKESVLERKRAAEIDPSPRQLAKYAEALWAERSYEEAEPILEKVIQSDPNQAQWQYLVGDVLFRQRRSEEAVSYLEAAVKLKPDLLIAHAVLGRVYLQLGKAALAIPHLEKGQPTDPEAIAFQLSQARRQSAK